MEVVLDNMVCWNDFLQGSKIFDPLSGVGFAKNFYSNFLFAK